MRFIFVLFAFLLITSPQLPAQEVALPKTEHTWSDKKGNPIATGVLQRIEKNKIFIKSADGNTHTKITDLSDKDRKYASCLYIYQQNKLQYEELVEQIATLGNDPETLLLVFEGIHKNIKDAPYAAAMMGVIYAAEMRDYKKALSSFKKAQNVIKSGQSKERLGSGFHESTAAAIQNNIAVHAFKTGDSGKGAGTLSRKTKGLQAIPFCNHHNAGFALKACKMPPHRVNLESGEKKKVQSVLLLKPVGNLGRSLPPLFLYSLDFDSPPTLNQVLQLLEQGVPLQAHGLNPLFPNNWCGNQWLSDDWCPHCGGTFKLECPNKSCRKGLVEEREVVVIARDPNTGRPHTRTEGYHVNCPVCKNRDKGKVECHWCNRGRLK